MHNQNEKEQFIQYLNVERHYSPLTLQAYERDIDEFALFLALKHLSYDKVKVSQAKQYLASLFERDLQRSSISRHVSSLRSFYNFLIRHEFVKENPFDYVTIKNKHLRLPQFFYEPEVDKVLEAAKGSTPLDLRNSCMLELLYATGIRVSECASIQLTDINFDLQVILINGKGGKQRYVPFGNFSKTALDEYLQSGRTELMYHHNKNHSYLFVNHLGDPISSTGIEYVLKQVIKKSGLNMAIHPHKMRHTFATHMLNNGADMRSVQELLGHSNLSSTQIYTHVTKEKLRASYQQFHPRAQRREDQEE